MSLADGWNGVAGVLTGQCATPGEAKAEGVAMAGEGEDMVGRKVRIPRELYARLQHAAEAYQVEGGVSGVVRRAFRAVASGRVGLADGGNGVAPWQTRQRATHASRPQASTVLTVFLPPHLSEMLDTLSAPVVCGLIEAYLDLPRPAPQRLWLNPRDLKTPYVVVPMEGLADGWKGARA